MGCLQCVVRESFAGIDLGGTIIKAAVFGGDGERLAERQVPTGDGEREGGVAVWKVRVRELLSGLEEECGRVAAVGVSSPGLAAADERSVLSMPGRMEGLEGWEWSGWLGRDEGVPVVNDAQAALLGEVWCGAARGCRDAVMFTLGTGVGGAIWSGGRLLRGHMGRAGHFGHLCLDLDGEPTIAGMPGGWRILWGISVCGSGVEGGGNRRGRWWLRWRRGMRRRGRSGKGPCGRWPAGWPP